MNFSMKTLLAGAVAGTLAMTAHASYADVLRFGQTATIPNLNPFLLAPAQNAFVHNLYDTLIRYDENLVPQPRLAESWEFSEDGRQLTLKLRQDATFHSGRKFVSSDVKASLDFVLDASNGALIRGFAARVVGVELPDDYTVVLKFEEPFPGVFDLLDLLFVIDGETAGDFSKTANGTGAFRIEDHRPGTISTFVRNENYWAGQPTLEGFEIVSVPNQQAGVLSLRSGEIDMMTELGWVDVAPFTRDDSFVTGSAPNGIAFDLSLNLKVPELQNPAVREAIDLSIDRERIAQMLYGPQGQTWCLPFAENSIAYFEEYDNCEYNLEKAEEVLKGAGIALPVELDILTSTELRAPYTTIAEILQADLAKIGIDLTIQNLDAVGYRSTYVDKREYEISSHAFGRAGKDPSSLLETTVVFRPDGNITSYDNPAYKDAIKAGGSTADPEARREAYREVARILREDRFILPTVPAIFIYVAPKSVEGFKWSADGFAIFEKATLNN